METNNLSSKLRDEEMNKIMKRIATYPKLRKLWSNVLLFFMTISIMLVFIILINAYILNFILSK